MTHLDTCTTGEDFTCTACVWDGYIQRNHCHACGSCRWVHYCGGRIYNPVTGRSIGADAATVLRAVLNRAIANGAEVVTELTAGSAGSTVTDRKEGK
jgi:hypothetical protein